MRVKKDKTCEPCYGLGWIISTVSGSRYVPDGTVEIERCDECQVYKWDHLAARSPEAMKALAAALRSWRSYANYMYVLTGHSNFAIRKGVKRG